MTIASNNPADDPVIDPNYYVTEADRYVIRTGLRGIGKMITGTKEGRAFVKSETTLSGFEPICSVTSDEEIDRRVAKVGG